MSIKLSTEYVISVISAIKADKKRVFLGIDSNSGGYGYWTDYVGMARKYSKLDELYKISKDDYLRKEVVEIQVLRVNEIAEIVTTEEIVSEAKAKAMAEVAEIQKKLDKKLAELRSMS